MKIEVTDRWHEAFPGGHVGVILIGNVDNTVSTDALDQRKREIEADLRGRYGEVSRAELHELSVLKAYRTYYKRFKKTYHVQGQLESIAHKGRTLPNVNLLVDANFAAELQTFLLSAGHDADLLAGPVIIDATQGTEPFTQLNDTTRTLKANDMMMTDGDEVACTIIYGQDKRTPITATTQRALYVTYAPSGVTAEEVQVHLDVILENVRLVAPAATCELSQIFSAKSV